MEHRDVSLTILGLVRDGGPELTKTLVAVHELRQRLHHSACIIATNDNTDNTDAVLAKFAGQNADCTVLSLDGLARAQPQRVERISVARNIVLASMWQMAESAYTLILDLDGPNVHLPTSRILAALETAEHEQWDALFANQSPAYYDIYALRHPEWCPLDAWLEIRRRRRAAFGLASKHRLVAELIHDRQFAIPPTHPLIPVQSAFGGLGLYRTAALKGAWYGARDSANRITCEHVVLHQAMLANGRRLFIDPSLLNEAPAEHLGATSGRLFPGFD
ncbi:MAG: hypothetical protein JXQ99_16615 [Hyphomicrobiaceae bacterium]